MGNMDKSLAHLQDGDEALLALYRSKLPEKSVPGAPFGILYNAALGVYVLYSRLDGSPRVPRRAEDVRKWTNPAKVWRFLACNWTQMAPNPRSPVVRKKAG